MKKARPHYGREFKISVVAELEDGKPPAQIVRQHGIHLSLPLGGEVIQKKRSAARISDKSCSCVVRI